MYMFAISAQEVRQLAYLVKEHAFGEQFDVERLLVEGECEHCGGERRVHIVERVHDKYLEAECLWCSTMNIIVKSVESAAEGEKPGVMVSFYVPEDVADEMLQLLRRAQAT